MRTITDRAQLLSRIEVEARASANAHATTRNLRYGRVLGLLEAGAILGYSSRRAASRIGDAVYHGATPRMLRPMLKACDIPPYPGFEGGSKRPSGPGGANDGRIHLSVRPPGPSSPLRSRAGFGSERLGDQTATRSID